MKNAAQVYADQEFPLDPQDRSTSFDENSIEAMRLQLKMLSKGVAVHVIDVQETSETDSLFVIKLQIMTELGNGLPMFGQAKLRLAKQAAGKLKAALAKLD